MNWIWFFILSVSSIQRFSTTFEKKERNCNQSHSVIYCDFSSGIRCDFMAIDFCWIFESNAYTSYIFVCCLSKNHAEMCFNIKTYVVRFGVFTRFFFYKNILYKNIHDEICRKVKNVLRISPSWNLFCQTKLSTLSFLWV